MSDDPQQGPQVSSGIGLVLVALVVLFAAAGYGLDHWLHTRPWLMVAGVFVGFGLGLTYLVLTLRSDPSDPGIREKTRGDDKGPDEKSPQ